MLKHFVGRLFNWVLKPVTYNSDKQTTFLLNLVSTGATQITQYKALLT